MTVYGYVRVSHADSFASGLSHEAQIDSVLRFAQYKGLDLQLQNILAEPKNVSGSVALVKRVRGKELSVRLAPGDHVVFSRIDRAFRDVRDALNMLTWWKERGITVHFASEEISIPDPKNPMAEVFLGMCALFAQWERLRISERNKETIARRSARGDDFSTTPGCGYRWDRSDVPIKQRKRLPVREELTVLQYIIKSRAAQVSFDRIAAKIVCYSQYCVRCEKGINGRPKDKCCPRCGGRVRDWRKKNGEPWTRSGIVNAYYVWCRHQERQAKQSRTDNRDPPTNGEQEDWLDH